MNASEQTHEVYVRGCGCEGVCVHVWCECACLGVGACVDVRVCICRCEGVCVWVCGCMCEGVHVCVYMCGCILVCTCMCVVVHVCVVSKRGVLNTGTGVCCPAEGQ